MGGQQFNHKREEWRLRTAQIVSAVAVGNMTPGVDLGGKVGHHIFDFIPVAALSQAKHGEVAIPVIDFAKASAGHHVRFWQRQQRIPFFYFNGTAGQHWPESIDMLAQGLPFWRNVLVVFLRQGKIKLDKVPQIKAGLIFLHTIIGKDHQRIAVRDGVSERFLVREKFGALHVVKQRSEQDIGRLRDRAGLFSLSRQRRQSDKCAAERQTKGCGATGNRTRHKLFSLSLQTMCHCIRPSENLRRISAAARVRGNILSENRVFTGHRSVPRRQNIGD